MGSYYLQGHNPNRDTLAYVEREAERERAEFATEFQNKINGGSSQYRYWTEQEEKALYNELFKGNKSERCS